MQIQGDFNEKWKEYGSYIDYTLNDYELEINNRAKRLNTIEEKLYKLAMALNPLILKEDESLSKKELVSVQDNIRVIIEDILTAGIEYAGNNSRSTYKEHLLAKQMYLKEFKYNKEDIGIREQFQFMSSKLCEELLECSYGNFFYISKGKKKTQMENLIQHLKDIEKTFIISIQLREKQLYLYKSHTESFRGPHSNKHSINVKNLYIDFQVL